MSNRKGVAKKICWFKLILCLWGFRNSKTKRPRREKGEKVCEELEFSLTGKWSCWAWRKEDERLGWSSCLNWVRELSSLLRARHCATVCSPAPLILQFSVRHHQLHLTEEETWGSGWYNDLLNVIKLTNSKTGTQALSLCILRRRTGQVAWVLTYLDLDRRNNEVGQEGCFKIYPILYSSINLCLQTPKRRYLDTWKHYMRWSCFVFFGFLEKECLLLTSVSSYYYF